MKAVKVAISRTPDGDWVATTDHPPMFGEGFTPTSAFDDWLFSMRRLYADLLESEDRLGTDHLRGQLKWCRDHEDMLR